jgi:hypothetical protein
MRITNKTFLTGLLVATLGFTLSACSTGATESAAPSIESTGSQVSVSEVRECGGEDGTTWYWAPCFKVQLAPFTKMTCKIAALDANGEVVATMEDEFNTLNGGFTTGYGDGAGTRDTTKEIYQSIDSLQVNCSL